MTCGRAALIVSLSVLTGCLNPCASTDIQELVSPDGTIVARVYEYDCGATTYENTRVSLRWRRWLSPAEADILLIDYPRSSNSRGRTITT